MSGVTAKAPPTIATISTSDRLVSMHAQLLNEALTRTGVPHEISIFPGNDHGFDVNWGGFGTQIARVKITHFLERYVDR